MAGNNYIFRFACDWATAEIVWLILKNRRDYCKKLDLSEDVELEVSGSRIVQEDMDDDVSGDEVDE